MENETARASGGRSDQGSEGWAEIEAELDSFVAASEATPMRVQKGTPGEDELREVVDSKNGELQSAETRHAEKRTATARPSGVHHLSPNVETRPEAQAAASSGKVKNGHDLASFLAGKVRMMRETGANLTLAFDLYTQAGEMPEGELRSVVREAIRMRVESQDDLGSRDADGTESAREQHLRQNLQRAEDRASSLSEELRKTMGELQEAKEKMTEVDRAFQGSTYVSPPGRTYQGGAAPSSFMSPFIGQGDSPPDKKSLGARHSEMMAGAETTFRYSLSAADAERHDKYKQQLSEHLSRFNHGGTSGDMMPTLIPDGDLAKLESEVRKKAEEMCSAKMAKAITSEGKIFELVAKILVAAGVKRTILIRALQKDGYTEVQKHYFDSYEGIEEKSMTSAQNKEMSFVSRREAVMRQDDCLLIAVVEHGLAKMSTILHTQCLQRVPGVAASKQTRLSDSRFVLGAGMLYLMEAVTHLYKSNWYRGLSEFNDLMDMPHVMESVCNGSIDRMTLEIEANYDAFEERHGTIDRQMLTGFALLTVIEKIQADKRTPHLVTSIEFNEKMRYFDSTRSDFQGAKSEIEKLIRLMSEDERSHKDESVRTKVGLKLKDMESELRKHRSSVKHTSHAAIEKARGEGYNQGVRKCAATIVMSPSDAEQVLKVDFQESMKKVVDESQQLGNILSKMEQKIAKANDGKLATSDVEVLKELGQRLSKFSRDGMLSKGSEQRGRDRRGESRGRSRGRSASRSDKSRGRGESEGPKDRSKIDCIFWKRGECTKGDDCEYRHHIDMKGKFPDANFKWLGKKKGEQAHAAKDTEESDAPECANPKCDKKARWNPKKHQYYDYCRYGCSREHKETTKSEENAHAADIGEVPAGDAALGEIINTVGQELFGDNNWGTTSRTAAADNCLLSYTVMIETGTSTSADPSRGGSGNDNISTGNDGDDGNELHKIQMKGMEIEVTKQELTSTPDAELQISILEGAYWLTNMRDMDEEIDTDKIRPLWFAGDSFDTNLYRLTPEMTRLGEIATLCECAWEQVLSIRHQINAKVAAGNDIDDKGTGIVMEIIDDLLVDVDQIAQQKRDEVTAAIETLFGSDSDTSKAEDDKPTILAAEDRIDAGTDELDHSGYNKIVQLMRSEISVESWIEMLHELEGSIRDMTCASTMASDGTGIAVGEMAMQLGHSLEIASMSCKLMCALGRNSNLDANTRETFRSAAEWIQRYHPKQHQIAAGRSEHNDIQHQASEVQRVLEEAEYQKVKTGRPKRADGVWQVMKDSKLPDVGRMPAKEAQMVVDAGNAPHDEQETVATRGRRKARKKKSPSAKSKAEAWLARMRARKKALREQRNQAREYEASKLSTKPADTLGTKMDVKTKGPPRSKGEYTARKCLPRRGHGHCPVYPNISCSAKTIAKCAARCEQAKGRVSRMRAKQRQLAIGQRVGTIGETRDDCTSESERDAGDTNEQTDVSDPTTRRNLWKRAIRTIVRYHREERWQRSAKDYRWGSDKEIRDALDDLVSKNAFTAQASADDSEQSGTSDDADESESDSDESDIPDMTRCSSSESDDTESDTVLPGLVRSSSSESESEGSDHSETGTMDSGYFARAMNESETGNGCSLTSGRAQSSGKGVKGDRLRLVQYSNENAQEYNGDDEADDGGDWAHTADRFDVGGGDSPHENDEISPQKVWSAEHTVLLRKTRATIRLRRITDDMMIFHRNREIDRIRKTTVKFAPEPSSAFMQLGALVSRIIEFDSETQEYISAPAFEAVKFLECYNVRARQMPLGVRLLLYDTGSTTFLSPEDHHFPVELKCDVKINGIGQQVVTSMAPQIISVLDVDAKTYVTFPLERGYRMKSLSFGILPSGPLQARGFEFYVREINPYFRTPDGTKCHIIVDYHTGLSWIAERPQAKPSVDGRRRILELCQNRLDCIEKRPEVIGEAEEMPTVPDSKENIDRALGCMMAGKDGSIHGYHVGGAPRVPIAMPVSTRRQKLTEKEADPTEDGGAAGKGSKSSVDSDEEVQPPTSKIECKEPTDEEIFEKAEEKAAKKKRPVYVKLPSKFLLETGDSTECKEFLEYWHALAGHLEWKTILEVLDFIEGGDFVRAIHTLRKSKGTSECKLHCDACARMKAKGKPAPKSRTTRCTCEHPPDKLYIDASGAIDCPSVYHNFLYYLLATTEKGFFLVQGMTFKSQSLFQIAKMFSEVGGPPRAVGIDGAGELDSRVSERFFAHHLVQVDRGVAGEHWKLARAERGHGTLKTMTRCTMAHAGAPREFWYFALKHMALTANLLLRAKHPESREKLDMTLWEAHYGQRPNVSKYLPGPWGCLAYVTLSKEARDARKFDKAFGPRAIGGIFIGCHVNPHTNVYHFLIHDGHSIISTTSDLRVVGDCYPFRWQRGRDVTLRLAPPDDEDTEDDCEGVDDVSVGNVPQDGCPEIRKGKVAWVKIRGFPHWPCVIWSEDSLPADSASGILAQKVKGSVLVYTLGDYRFHWAQPENVFEWGGDEHDKFSQAKAKHKDEISSKKWGSFRRAKKEAEAEIQRPGSHFPRIGEQMAMSADLLDNRIRGRDVESLVLSAQAESDRMSALEIKFVRKHDPRSARKMEERIEGKGAKFGNESMSKSKQLMFAARAKDQQNRKLHKSIIENAESGERSRDEYLRETEDANAPIEHDDPLDFVIEKGPDEFEFERPYEGARFQVVQPVDHSDSHKIARDAKHPYFKFVGRRVRKTITIGRNRQQNRLEDVGRKQVIKGTVTVFNDRTSLFRIRYDDGKEEQLEILELKPIVVMSRDKGDPENMHGLTRQEVLENEIQQVLHAEVLNEYLGDHIPHDYGEGETGGNESDDTSPQSKRGILKTNLQAQGRSRKSVTYASSTDESENTFQAKEEQAAREKDTDETEEDDVPRDDEPQNIKEARQHPEWEEISKCWETEMKQLKDLGVYQELSEQQLKRIKEEGHKILNAKMVTKRKYQAVRGKDGMVRDRFHKWKGRLAGVGTREIKGVDMPWSTFSPVIGLVAVRTVMSMMCREDMIVNAYDLSGAFLAADLDREVYMKLPAECGEMAGKIVKLVKAIYGLKTSSRDYTQAFCKKVLEFEHDGCKFKQLYMDACIFRFVGKNGEEIILCHYVDDLILGTNSSDLRDKVLEHIRQKWKVTDEGQMTRFVGLNFARSSSGKKWTMSCAPYIDKIGKRFNVDDGRYPDTPMDAAFVVTPEDLKEEPTEEMMTEYRSLIGSIGFAATTVRYDIAYAVSTLSRYLMKPNSKVIEAAKRVVRYLLKTKDFCITWSTEEGDIDPERINRIWGAVDASFASDPITRRSHSGFLIFNNGGCISWKSGLQKMVTLSSCESEFVGLCGAVVEIRYLRQLMEELGYAQESGTILWEDNKACIILAEGETSCGGRSKHIDVKLRHIAESVKKGIVSVRYIPTAWNYADIMTKPLGRIQFARIRDLCMMPEVRGTVDSGEPVPKEVEIGNLILDLEGDQL